ncbi:glycosyl transferase [Nocardia sp. SYP-A9097]|uniref:glycosyltransferase family 39 protein n=1 Tax=Nocardia sp. SYP-A9097 TaxID=2663237 RepID=UPI00129AA392|nr:glycosyltransferase family 39 protein [Nocardia sp. SYP-A9097]MRH91935.1 glycosyl transferase [Nocardia sp. SYP-A9097]
MTTTLTERQVVPPPARATARISRWEYPALATLLIGTAIAYLWNLSVNGWANSFYAAAVQAGSVSWKAFFFGASDAANSITVDKTPLSLWPMEISVRIFGLHSWSMLLPQALIGVASVALLWATVRRVFGPGAGSLAGLALAVTPVAALMFRFNNPDALLVLLMIAATWAMTRAVEDGRWRWLLYTGLFIGLGFLTKQLQVLLVLPALALTYLVAGPPKLGKRIAQLFAAGAAMLAGAGWWLLIAEFWPAEDRPYFGGSQHNSIVELTLGYNGLGRLNGDETGSVGPGGELPAGGNGMWGATGITRMFEPQQGGQIAWLIPAALLLLVAVLVLRGRASRTNRQRAGIMLWGGWLLVTGLVFSFMKGIFHQYYTVALAPAVAALAGIGAAMLWREREKLWVRAILALTLGSTVATAWMLLSRSGSFQPWLRWTIAVAGVVVTALLLVRLPRRIELAAATAAVVIGLAGPLAYTVDTLTTGHEGPIPSAGPNVRGGFGFGPGGPRGEGAPRMNADGGRGGPGGAPGNRGGPNAQGGREGGGAGNFMMASKPSAKVTALLSADGDEYTWVAAAIGSNSAAGFQLATQLPVMPVGGFNGSDPSPTPEQFQRYVADGDIHYFIGGGGGMGSRSGSHSSEITQWVQDHFTSQEVDGVTLYDLTQPKS